eukprot:CAMPEP_0113818630 /NCGR_PEP_ID=MMETSP0328-20130328/336_1 /TAXON_ID=39455 /ORGANISM="Alexandrium minutum" /LENGTH=301 /DNA_ID=CAMNT_0000786565 /DNA_START=204 /DNA_END=1108 /DNA_ORIENTATION=+ /assembly_acc=CAM_ASM_000350
MDRIGAALNDRYGENQERLDRFRGLYAIPKRRYEEAVPSQLCEPLPRLYSVLGREHVHVRLLRRSGLGPAPTAPAALEGDPRGRGHLLPVSSCRLHVVVGAPRGQGCPGLSLPAQAGRRDGFHCDVRQARAEVVLRQADGEALDERVRNVLRYEEYGLEVLAQTRDRPADFRPIAAEGLGHVHILASKYDDPVSMTLIEILGRCLHQLGHLRRQRKHCPRVFEASVLRSTAPLDDRIGQVPIEACQKSREFPCQAWPQISVIATSEFREGVVIEEGLCPCDIASAMSAMYPAQASHSMLEP